MARAEHPEVSQLRIDCNNVGRLDYSGAATLATLVADADEGGVTVEFTNIPPHATRALAAHLGGRHGVPRLEDLPLGERHQWHHGRGQDARRET